MKLLWVLLICLKEAQPAHVNVNVKVKGNANNDIEPGSMPPTWPRPPVQPNFPGNLPSYPQASVSSRSLSARGGSPIPRSSPRWIKCQSSLWTKECEDGKLVLKTLSGLKEEACEALCLAESGCATFLFEKKNGDCALTNVAKGTSGSNGISGPELVHQKPKPSIKKGRERTRQNEDCSEFHFDECMPMVDHQVFKQTVLGGFERGQTKWDWQYRKDCHIACLGGVPNKDPEEIDKEGKMKTKVGCTSVAWQPESDIDGQGYCGLNSKYVDLMIHFNCDVYTGRVDRSDVNMFNTCLYRFSDSSDERTKCRTGECALQHYGEIINESPADDEHDCKQICYSSGHRDFDKIKIRCTHYKYYPHKDFQNMNDSHIHSPKEGTCEMYHVNETTAVPNYNCAMTWEMTPKTGQDEFGYCANSLPITPEIHATTSSPTTTTSSTTTAITRACNIVIKASDAVNSDALSDVSVTYAAANNANIKNTKTTGDNGKVTIDNLEVGTTVALTLQKDNYDEYTHNIVVDSNTCNTEFDLGLNPTTTGGKGRIVMSWAKEDPRDVDLHLISTDCHVYYVEKTCDENVLDRDNTAGGPNGPETTTVNNYGSGETFIVATQLFSGSESLCYGQVEVKIYPGDGIDTQTYAIPSDCSFEMRWWFVGCFNSDNKLRYFDFKNELLTEKPTLDMC